MGLKFTFFCVKKQISTWSSGTGGAGVLGALSYSVLTQMNLTPRTTLLVMISVPILEALAFYILLRHPTEIVKMEKKEDDPVVGADEQPLVGFKEQVQYFPSLLKYIVPLVLVYVFEYFINQGLVNFHISLSLFPSNSFFRFL